MTSNRARFLSLVPLFLAFGGCSLRAEDWKTTDGKVYANVTVIKSEADAVTILYRDGGALIPMANLPPDLQKRFKYDPAKAKVAARERAMTDSQDAKALAAEMEQAKTLKAVEQAKEKAQAAADASKPPVATASNDPLDSVQFELDHHDPDPKHHDVKDADAKDPHLP
jgi:hypothetical protein